jgi:hypothetical protein
MFKRLFKSFKSFFKNDDDSHLVDNFNKIKDCIRTKGNTENNNYYTLYIHDYQTLNSEQINDIIRVNPTFVTTDKILVELICFNVSNDNVMVFVENCKTGIYEFITIDAKLYNILGWKVNDNNASPSNN